MLLNSIIKRFWQILGQPRYTITASSGTINEGSSVTFTVNTRRVRTGTVLYYTLTGSGITSADISDGALSGSFTITNGTGSVTITMTNDATTEGNESLTFQLRTGSTSGTIEATSTITVNDTSAAPSETYTVTLNNPASGQLNIAEGWRHSFNVSISGWDGNATRYWTVGGPQSPGSGTYGDSGTADADAGDFSPSSGSFTVSGTPGGAATGTIEFNVAVDASNEGSQDYSLAVRTGSTGGPVVGISQQGVGGQLFGYITDNSTGGRFVQYMIVGGGGAGGHDAGGGGGGGGMIEGSWYFPTSVAQQIVLGAGGARTTGAGNTGTASRIGLLVANGGGGGASIFGGGAAGGSGGGGGHKGGAGGNGTLGIGGLQGHKGAGWGDYCTGGGGGGSGGSAGGGGNWNINPSNSRTGGPGRASSLAQPVIAVQWFGGGGGGGSHCTATIRSQGGGGQVAPVVSPNYSGGGFGGGGWQVCPGNLSTNGTLNTGGGGGGNGNLGCNGVAGAGGSGIIWLRTPSINAAGVTFTPGVTRTTFPSVNGTTVFRITATTASQTVTFT